MGGQTKILAMKPDPEKWNLREVVPTIEKDPTHTSTLRNDAARYVKKLLRGMGKEVGGLLDLLKPIIKDNPLVGQQLERGRQVDNGMWLGARKVTSEQYQTPQDDFNIRLQGLMGTTNNPWVKDQLGDFVGMARERADKRAGREMKAIKVPTARAETESGRAPIITPKDEMIQETLTSVTTDLITSLQQNYLSDVKRTIETGLVQGTPRKELVSQITDMTGNLGWQAERIIRTEMVRAFNTSLRNRIETDGVQWWQWVASEERTYDKKTGKAGRTCEMCSNLNGLVVKIGDPFMIHKGRMIRQPPDPHPNCRCSVRPVTTKQYDEFHGFKEPEEASPEQVEEILKMLREMNIK